MLPYGRGWPEASIVTCCPEIGSRMVMATSRIGYMENAPHPFWIGLIGVVVTSLLPTRALEHTRQDETNIQVIPHASARPIW